MFDNVIVGVDGGSHGRDAVALAQLLAGPAGQLTLVHVYQSDSLTSRGSSASYDAVERTTSGALLENERARAGVDAGIISVGADSVGAGLHRAAEQHAADLLVLGTCRHGYLGRVMLGDDTRAALNGAPCAVAIAPPGFAAEPAPFSVIGIAYNGSPESEAALDLARGLADRTQATVRARRVIPFPAYAVSGPMTVLVDIDMPEKLDQATQAMAGLDGVDGSATWGIPGEALAEFSQDLDLLIVGSRGYGPGRRLIHGSTSNYLMRHGRCPLLVLPRTAVTAGDFGGHAEHVGNAAHVVATAS